MRLITELVHPVVQLYGVVSSVYPSERPGGYASTHVYSPVDDIASLYEEVNASRPVPVLVHDASHFQNLLGIGQISMKVSDSHYPPGELAIDGALNFAGRRTDLFLVVANFLDGVEHFLARGFGGFVISVLRVFEVGVDGEGPGQWQAGHEIEDGNEGPTGIEDSEDWNEDCEKGEKAGHGRQVIGNSEPACAHTGCGGRLQ